MLLPLSFHESKSTSSPTTSPLLQPRADAADCGCTDGGTIAGIIIGSVAGILILIWLIRAGCMLNRGDSDVEGRETRRTYYKGDGGGSRDRRRGSRGSSYVSYRPEKSSRRYRSRDYDVQRPAKVYAV
ncbi:hypothetical protein FQN54_007894 [Arachnomyces sp. PD_36]|nr:hypothetical protein FQN54_007894 [Arachnomyces sp. PD_36]